MKRIIARGNVEDEVFFSTTVRQTGVEWAREKSPALNLYQRKRGRRDAGLKVGNDMARQRANSRIYICRG